MTVKTETMRAKEILQARRLASPTLLCAPLLYLPDAVAVLHQARTGVRANHRILRLSHGNRRSKQDSLSRRAKSSKFFRRNRCSPSVRPHANSFYGNNNECMAGVLLVRTESHFWGERKY